MSAVHRNSNPVITQELVTSHLQAVLFRVAHFGGREDGNLVRDITNVVSSFYACFRNYPTQDGRANVILDNTRTQVLLKACKEAGVSSANWVQVSKTVDSLFVSDMTPSSIGFELSSAKLIISMQVQEELLSRRQLEKNDLKDMMTLVGEALKNGDSAIEFHKFVAEAVTHRNHPLVVNHLITLEKLLTENSGLLLYPHGDDLSGFAELLQKVNSYNKDNRDGLVNLQNYLNLSAVSFLKTVFSQIVYAPVIDFQKAVACSQLITAISLESFELLDKLVQLKASDAEQFHAKLLHCIAAQNRVMQSLYYGRAVEATADLMNFVQMKIPVETNDGMDIVREAPGGSSFDSAPGSFGSQGFLDQKD